MSSVQILLATYNGERYLNELLQSLEGQTYPDWELLIRDDGSRDRTPEIVDLFQRKYPEKVRVIDSQTKHLGVIGSFSELMSVSTGDWVLLCDQDDVWIPTKIAEMLSVAEQKKLSSKDLHLIHSDLFVVDENLNTLGESFFQYQNIDPKQTNILRLIVQNNVTGCAMMASRGLVKKSLPIPQESCMQDWWMALVAASFGEIHLIEKPLVLYRQHANNDTGAKKYSLMYVLRNLFSMSRPASHLRQVVVQSGLFLRRYGDELSEPDRISLQKLSKIMYQARVLRVITLMWMGFKRSGIIRTLGFYYRIFLLTPVTASPSPPKHAHTETPET